MIEMGADINVQDMHGQTCLFYAAKHGRNFICDLLIEKGANVNHPDNK